MKRFPAGRLAAPRVRPGPACRPLTALEVERERIVRVGAAEGGTARPQVIVAVRTAREEGVAAEVVAGPDPDTGPI